MDTEWRQAVRTIAYEHTSLNARADQKQAGLGHRIRIGMLNISLTAWVIRGAEILPPLDPPLDPPP